MPTGDYYPHITTSSTFTNSLNPTITTTTTTDFSIPLDWSTYTIPVGATIASGYYNYTQTFEPQYNPPSTITVNGEIYQAFANSDGTLTFKSTSALKEVQVEVKVGPTPFVYMDLDDMHWDLERDI